MERNQGPVPSITDPAAEEAHRHLAWVPDDEPTFQPGTADTKSFVEYTGYPDGTFEVTVNLQRGDTVAVQSARSVGAREGQIRNALREAYEGADRALTVLSETGR